MPALLFCSRPLVKFFPDPEPDDVTTFINDRLKESGRAEVAFPAELQELVVLKMVRLYGPKSVIDVRWDCIHNIPTVILEIVSRRSRSAPAGSAD